MNQPERAARLMRLIDETARDIGTIQAALAGGPRQAVVTAVRDRYLTSGEPNRIPRFDANLEKVRQHFLGGSGYEWDVSDAQWGLIRQGQLKMFCAFGWTSYTDRSIKISPKAFHVNPLILKGILLHEVTHAQLTTADIAYDYGVFPSSSHAKLAALAPGDKMENADNWRVFYQDAMRA